MNKLFAFIKKNSMMCIVIILFVALFVTMLSIAIKKGTFSLDSANGVTIECPDSVKVGGALTCNVYLNVASGTILSANANYDFANEISYVSFTPNSECDGGECFDVAEATENGFAIGSVAGFNNDILLGTLSVELSGNANANSQYKVGLTNIELCDNEYTMYSINKFSVNVRSKNNVATLSNITLSTGSLNETFDSNTTAYTATVDKNVSTITINATPTDTNATITGNGVIENLNLHYGTNPYNLVVVSEDESVNKIYTINIYREYEFNTTVYTYNKNNNYIYTKGDSGNKIISNLEPLENGSNLSYAINGNKLEVKYGNSEVLSSINILNFNTTYTINDSNIYIGENVNRYTLLSNTTSGNLEFKVFNSSNTEITNDNEIIVNGNRLEVYYNDTKLDVYSVVTEYFEIDETLIVDDNKKIIKRLEPGINYQSLLSKIDTNGTITLISNDNKALTNESLVKTGDKIRIELGNQTITYTLSVLGLINSDSVVNFSDVLLLYGYHRHRATLTDEYIAACDINGDNTVNFSDVLLLYGYYGGKKQNLGGVQ